MHASSLVPLGALALVAVVVFSGLTPWSIAIAMPATFITLDTALGTARREPAAEPAWRWPLALFVPAQCAFLVATIVGALHRNIPDIAGTVVAGGMTIGIFGMLTAHELIHSRRRFERVLGIVALASVFYAHFRISHVLGHHRFAGTGDDPALAQRGESAYRFALRSACGQLRFAVRVDRRLTLAAGAVGVAMLGADYAIAGWRGVASHAGIGVAAIFILETFDYVAHYGLMRRERSGALEPFGPAHSWNVTHRFSNWALLNGGLHGAHHRAPAADHATLRADADLPALPGGFGVALCLALLPPLWHFVMDRRVVAMELRAS